MDTSDCDATDGGVADRFISITDSADTNYIVHVFAPKGLLLTTPWGPGDVFTCDPIIYTIVPSGASSPTMQVSVSFTIHYDSE